MTLNARETSRHLGEPVDLYYFRYGETVDAYYAYTDAEQPVLFDGVTYQPISIQRDSINASGTLDKSNLEVKTAKNAELAELFRLYPPSQVVSLVIRQGHINDPDEQYLAIWTGRVIGHKREQSEAIYTCEPISTSMRRPGCRRSYQRGCPHVLYGPMCRADKDAHTISKSVLEVTGPILRFASTWEAADKKDQYLGGLAEWETADGRTEVRTILRIKDSTHILLTGTASGLTAGVTVKLSKGCPHTMEACLDIFDNIQNYGGQPWIPEVNPIGIKNNFY